MATTSTKTSSATRPAGTQKIYFQALTGVPRWWQPRATKSVGAVTVDFQAAGGNQLVVCSGLQAKGARSLGEVRRWVMGRQEACKGANDSSQQVICAQKVEDHSGQMGGKPQWISGQCALQIKYFLCLIDKECCLPLDGHPGSPLDIF